MDALARIVDPDMMAYFPQLEEKMIINIDGGIYRDDDLGDDWMDL